MAEALDASLLPDDGPSRAARLAGVGLFLAVATTGANLLGYAFSVVLSRALGPEQYGALAALLALGLVGSVPAVAMQLLVAREASRGDRDGPAWLRLGAYAGVGLLLVTWLLSPVVSSFLGLSSVAGALWLGVALLPTTIAGAAQGLLLGSRRIGALALSYLLVAGLRFLGGCVAAIAGFGVPGALAMAATGTLAACLIIVLLAAEPGELAHLWRKLPEPSDRVRATALLTVASSTAAILVLTNIDVILSRHFLGGRESGQYAVASLFTKAAFWGPHFLAVFAFPYLSTHGSRRTSMLVGLGLTVLIGAVVVSGAGLAGGWVVSSTVGGEYESAGSLAARFALLGVLMAVLQFLLYAGLARRRRQVEVIVWIGIVIEIVAVAAFYHASMTLIVGVTTAVCAVLVVATGAIELRAEGAA
jgi:O-antigen/teichoic acid export membrane protein